MIVLGDSCLIKSHKPFLQGKYVIPPRPTSSVRPPLGINQRVDWGSELRHPPLGLSLEHQRRIEQLGQQSLDVRRREKILLKEKLCSSRTDLSVQFIQTSYPCCAGQYSIANYSPNIDGNTIAATTAG
jgi:hypothetical protein